MSREKEPDDVCRFCGEDIEDGSAEAGASDSSARAWAVRGPHGLDWGCDDRHPDTTGEGCGEHLPASMSAEEVASAVYSGFPAVVSAWGNRDSGALDPGVWIARWLRGLSVGDACLVGFRLAQGVRVTRAGDLQGMARSAIAKAGKVTD